MNFTYAAALLLSTAALQPVADSVNPEHRYLMANSEAMTRMMQDMASAPTGGVDRNFVEMMVAHHQGAIDMSRAVLLYGKNERVKRIAQEIIVTQRDEIAAMRSAIRADDQ